ncbi:SET and MYND domain-containing protein 4 [Drosophila kikkawai]|uniref:SET and MYND domain-containing protein 4 n=1 Tax=Drosophila kikkawai TaxID=30033 RepID=A0A6P4IWB4_DROKI|nr:SET and MYND domain-containing protein 4 [Drosophila kikkawai]
MDRLARIFSQQDELITLDSGFKDEYETFKSLHALPAEKRQSLEQLTLKLLTDLELPHDRDSCALRSRTLREEGNLVFRDDTKEAEQILKACRLYTGAVFEAEDASEELALAFANRGMALQEYGYYREAYDDCANALDCGYPEKLQHKVIMRQAFCAWKLENIEAFEEHLACLEKLQLNEGYERQVKHLKEKLELLKSHKKQTVINETEAGTVLEEILTDPGERGRYMVAKEAIPQGKVIFSERASCFVPLEQRLICHQCAATLMSAPIPCSQCHQRVVYCSRKCREKHLAIHRYECAAYRRDLLKLLGVSHLALRLVLTYVPLMLPHLAGCTSSQAIWSSITELSANQEQETVPEYVQSLSMASHLKQASQAELVYHMLCANLLQTYLKEHTDFFKQFNASSASIEDWQVVISALILRSAGQLLANGHVSSSLLPVGLQTNEFALLQSDMWESPLHLRLGQLHNLARSELITAINLPYLSLCNHGCAPSISTKFDGCSVVNYSLGDLARGEEIFNCYTRDYRNSLKQQRLQALEEVYKFQCSCDKCKRPDPDQDYLAFHRYRCEKPNCRQIFTPDVDGLPQNSLNWWLHSQVENSIVCTVCQERQLFPWYNDFLDLVESCVDYSKRQLLFQAYDDLDKWLMEHHSLKRNLAGELIMSCFVEIDVGCILEDWEYENLAKVIRHQLKGTAAQCGANSLEYLTEMTYLWDLIALKKCESNEMELLELKGKLEYLASEYREVFLNYYNDFIEQQCK